MTTALATIGGIVIILDTATKPAHGLHADTRLNPLVTAIHGLGHAIRHRRN